MTATSKRRRGFQPNKEGLAILEARRLEKGYTYKSLVEAAGLNGDDQVRRLFNPDWGYNVQRDAIEKIAAILELQPAEFIEDWLPKSRGSKQKQTPIDVTNIDWQRVCQEMLHEQQEEQRFRRRATEMGFEVNVFVPLGLIERKQQQRRSGNVPVELLHQLEPEVVTRIYEHNEFMTDVIGQNPTGKNQHIAIVGEPGAGKTTLLDKIATHIQENNRDLPICIALASLQGKTLKDYILQEWLPEAMPLVYPDIDVEKSHKTSLQKRLRHGGVWLLLDGVDEMAVGANSCLSLEEIRNQLTDWLGNVRVVLTCRTNVWDASLNNPLTGFDTYKTQEFKQEQVHDFIQQWFAEAKNIERGQELQRKLQEPQKERIRQLVKNPLRLSLLCQISSKNKQVELPETKAELYQHFVRYFYEWKPSQTVIDWATQPGLQEELHQALGRLSIAGLDSDNRFRLSLSLIEKQMGHRLFKLAWDLGWLNLVDRESATDEPVYAFFHPTFQEYFASLVINYQIFMERYRIFETQWLEVAILWLENPQILAGQKKELNDTIINLKEDKWKNMYRLKLLPLNIVYSCQIGEIEFIAAQILFVCWDDNMPIKEYKLRFPGYEEFVIESLKYYAPKEACDRITEVVINNTDLELDELSLSRLLEVLFKINPEHECLKVLIPKLLKDDNEGRAIEVAKIALKNDNFKQIAVDFLVNALLNEDEQDELHNVSIIKVLIDSKILEKVVIGKLTSFLNSQDSMIQSLAISHLGRLSLNHNALVNNQEVLDALIDFISQNRDNQISIIPAIDIVKRLDIDISKVNRAIIDLLYNSQYPVLIMSLFDYLDTQGFIGEIINKLIQLIANEEDRHESIAYAQLLVMKSLSYPKIFENQSIIEKLICLVKVKIDYYYVLVQIFSQTTTMYERFKIVGYQSSKDKIFIDVISLRIENYRNENITEELNSTTNDDTENIEGFLIERQIEKQYIEFVSLISDPENLNLTNLRQNHFTGKLYIGDEIAIAKIKQTNFEVIDKIIDILQINKDNILRDICIEILIKIETLSQQSIVDKLVHLTVNLKDSEIQWFLARELQQITHKAQLQMLVFGLKDYVEDAVAKSDCNLYIITYSLLWHCANHLSYAEFYDACCVQPSCTDLEALENISVANSSTAQYLNIVEQLSVLQSAVSHNEELNQAVQMIYIDGSEFNPSDNPATHIYIQMVEQGCPERQEGIPTTMPLLKAYWRLNLRNLEKRVALVFYNSKIDREFSEPFLTALSAFGGTIAIITDRPCDNVKRISPNDPNLIDAVLKWLHRSILEA